MSESARETIFHTFHLTLEIICLWKYHLHEYEVFRCTYVLFISPSVLAEDPMLRPDSNKYARVMIFTCVPELFFSFFFFFFTKHKFVHLFNELLSPFGRTLFVSLMRLPISGSSLSRFRVIPHSQKGEILLEEIGENQVRRAPS